MLDAFSSLRSPSAELVTELELLSDRLDFDSSFFLDPLGLSTCFNSESNQEASVKFRPSCRLRVI
jgi:hypothetical protein